LRRRADGTAVVAVRSRDRPPEVVAADLVDGVLAANRLTGAEVEAARSTLLSAALDAPTAA
jgi:hypothetical protein